MKQQKIRLIVAISDFRIGGAQKVVADLINNFDQEKFEIHLLTFFLPKKTEENFFNIVRSGIIVHKLDFTNFYDIRATWSLYSLLRKIDADIVWSHLFFSNTLIRVLKPLFRYKVVIVEHNTYVFRRKLEKIANRILANITFKIVAVSEYVATFTSLAEKIPQSKFTVIYNGVDVKKLLTTSQIVSKEVVCSELGIPSNSKIFLNIGQFIPQKNQELLIEAFSLVAKSHAESRLVILGEGTFRSRLESQIVSLGLEGKVILPGVKKDVARYYGISECFVLSSIFEGFPIVAIEALSCGLPIISTRVSSSDIYVQEGKNGFLSDLDATILARHMVAMLEMDKMEQDSFRQFSKEISREFDITTVAKKYETLLVSSLG